MSDKRWVSRGLIEMQKYDSAAEVVSGSESLFLGLSKQLGDAIAHTKQTGSDYHEVQQVLDGAKEEIKDHQQWQKDVLKKLQKRDGDRGLTRQLRQAFSDSAAARTKLNELIDSHDHAQKAKEREFRIER